MGALAGGATVVAYQCTYNRNRPSSQSPHRGQGSDPGNVKDMPSVAHSVVLRSGHTVCRSEGRKDAPVSAAAPEEQEDGEVQMAAHVAQNGLGMPVHVAAHAMPSAGLEACTQLLLPYMLLS